MVLPTKDTVQIKIVRAFRREDLCSALFKSCAVILDNRPGRIRKHIKDKIYCIYAPGRADKRTLCNHVTMPKDCFATENSEVRPNSTIKKNNERYWIQFCRVKSLGMLKETKGELKMEKTMIFPINVCLSSIDKGVTHLCAAPK